MEAIITICRPSAAKKQFAAGQEQDLPTKYQ
jgi:hypothetical protein